MVVNIHCSGGFLPRSIVWLVIALATRPVPAIESGAQSFVHNELTRTYRIHIPPAYSGQNPVPLVIALHGGGGTGARMERMTGFNTIADRDGFIVVYPDGINHQWNDGRLPDRRADDVGFIAALIDDLRGRLQIAPNRIFVTGVSNGAMMSHRLACELSERIAAIAPVIGSIPENRVSEWKPTEPVSVLIINGDQDPLVPWDGGEVRFGRRKLGRVISTDDAVSFWVTHDACRTPPIRQDLPDLRRLDGATATRFTYPGGKNGTDVVLYRVHGGGHTWPGTWRNLPNWLVGRTCRDFSASEVVWEFFKNHPRNLL